MPARAATPEDGRRAYDAGHYSDAMGIWAELSRQGSAESAFGLGLLYDLGNGIQQDSELAFFWYKVAAEAGLPAAEFNVGAMYDGGHGVERDTSSAAVWFAKAAAHGHARAQFDLGQLYEQGDGVPRNPEAAAAWFREALQGGIAAAATRLKKLEAAPSSSLGSPAASAPRLSPGGSAPVAKRLSPAKPVSPSRNATLTLAPDHPQVELVWVAPPEPQNVHYEVQVRLLADSSIHTVFAATLDETATLVILPSKPDFYVWNVDTIGPDGSRAASDWNWFSTGSPGPSQQSMTSGPSSR